MAQQSLILEILKNTLKTIVDLLVTIPFKSHIIKLSDNSPVGETKKTICSHM